MQVIYTIYKYTQVYIEPRGFNQPEIWAYQLLAHWTGSNTNFLRPIITTGAGKTKLSKPFVSFHTKVREFCSLGINPKIYPKEPIVNTNPNNQSQNTIVPKDTVSPCPYVYRHSGVRTVWHNRVWHCIVQASHKQLNLYIGPQLG